jgi:hypothetical protein
LNKLLKSTKKTENEMLIDIGLTLM